MDIKTSSLLKKSIMDINNRTISTESLTELRMHGLTWAQISRHFGVTYSTIKWFRRVNNFSDRFDICSSKTDYSNLDRIKTIVEQYSTSNPNCGEKMLQGYLLGVHDIKISREKLREIIQEVDPDGRSRRLAQKLSSKITRVKYSVPGPGYLWHGDTYHKIGRFGFVVFGQVDGFTHECICLKMSTNNFASSVLDAAVPKIYTFGAPRLIRGDAGMENVGIGQLMNALRGPESFLIGKSVNNQRIERFWRDVADQVLGKYYAFFHSFLLVNQDLLECPENIWIMQHLFLDKMKFEIKKFREAWNSHSLRASDNTRCSPGARRVLSENNHYIQIDHDDNEVRQLINDLRSQYEGRPSSRSISSFENPKKEILFKERCPPLLELDETSDFGIKLQSAFHEANELLNN